MAKKTKWAFLQGQEFADTFSSIAIFQNLISTILLFLLLLALRNRFRIK